MAVVIIIAGVAVIALVATDGSVLSRFRRKGLPKADLKSGVRRSWRNDREETYVPVKTRSRK